jgi:hypothetical protein
MRVAVPQCGLFDREQWSDCGGDDKQLSYRLSTGAITHEGVGVYGLPGWPETFMRSVWRAHLVAGRHSVASSWTAAALHELWPFPPGKLVVSVPHGGHNRPSPAFVRQPRDLTEDHVVLVDGMRTTSIARTFCDLAADCRVDRLARGIDAAHLNGQSDVSETIAMYDALRKPGKPGFKALGRLLEVRRADFALPPTYLSGLFKRLLKKYNLPEPRWEAPLPWAPTRRADGIWLPQRKLVELDSRSWHARIDQMSSDRQRDRDARRNGFEPYRFTYEEVRYSAAKVAAEVREILDLAA